MLAREELAFLLKSFPTVEIVGNAGDGLEALRLIRQLGPDLVFLDVQMPGLDGLGVVRKLVEGGDPLPHFVFATAYDQYAVEAFEVNAVDYLLKPIEKERLAKSIERAQNRLESPPKETASMEQLLAQLQTGLARPAKILLNKPQPAVLGRRQRRDLRHHPGRCDHRRFDADRRTIELPNH